MRKQNVFTKPGEAIPRRIPTIGTQAAGKYARVTLFRKRKREPYIYFSNTISNSLAPVMYNRILFNGIVYLLKQAFAEINANIR